MALNIVSEIDNRVAVKNVLMSVSDKTGLESFVPALVKACPGVKIYSTGGTYTKVKEILGDRAEPRKGVPAMSTGVEPCVKKGIFARNVGHLLLDDVEITGQEGEVLTAIGVDDLEQETEENA